MDPSFGSQLFVYIPTAIYKFSGLTGSVAIASIPQSCQLVLFAKSTSGVHESSEFNL
jgi:hypothetical protein